MFKKEKNIKTKTVILMLDALLTKINNYLKTILAKTSLRTLLGTLALLFVIVAIILLAVTEYKTAYNTIYKERVARLKYIDEFAYEILEYQNLLVLEHKKTLTQAQNESMEMIKRVHFEADDYIWIDKYTGFSLYHPRPGFLKNVSVDEKINKIVTESGQGYLQYKWEKIDANKKKTFDKVSYVKGYKNWGWILGTGTYIDDLNYLVLKSMIVGGLSLLLFFTFLIIVFRFIVLKTVIRPIDELVDISLKLANNDLNITLPSHGGNTELGKLYMVVNKFIELIEKEKKTAQRAALLKTITEKIRSSLDIDETLSFICEETTKLFNVQRSSISTFDNSGNYSSSTLKKEYKVFPTIKGMDCEKDFNKLSEYLGHKFMGDCKVLGVDNVEEPGNPDYFKTTYKEMGVKSLIAASIKKDDNGWGVLVLSEYNNYRHWTHEEKNLLETITAQIYIAIKQAELYQNTKKILLVSDVANFFKEHDLENSIDFKNIKGYKFNSAIAFPIVSKSKLLGFYGIEYEKTTELTQTIIDFLTTLSEQTVIAMIQSELYSTIDKNEKYIRTVLDSIKDVIITIHDDFIIESCSPSIEAVWGYSALEVIGQNLLLLLSHDCYDKDKTICLSSKSSFGVKKNGVEFPIEIDVSEIIFEDKKLTLLVLGDITERKKNDKIKSEFVSTVSHELRTPLTSIKGSLGLIKSGVFGVLPEKVNCLIEIASNNCSRLTNLINDILDLEKIKAGKYTFIYEELEINYLVEQSIILNTSYAEQFGLSIKFIKLPQEGYIIADKNRLSQVISNLVSNAVKFSKLNSEVLVAIELNNGEVKISVVDKGVGIHDDSKHLIFQSFSQVDSSDTRSKGGTGLGLCISKSIIESMGGNIGFESQIDKGSTFFFILPSVEKGSFVKTNDETVKELTPDDF